MQFSEMTIAQIKEFLDGKSVKYTSKMKKADLIVLAESVKPAKAAKAAKAAKPKVKAEAPAEVKAEAPAEIKVVPGQATSLTHILASQVFNADNPLAVLMTMDKGTRRKVRQYLYGKGYKHLASLKTPPTAPSERVVVRRLAVA